VGGLGLRAAALADGFVAGRGGEVGLQAGELLAQVLSLTGEVAAA
jgi:hypothetical protein